MKRFARLTILFVLLFALGCGGVVQASIIPARGAGQIGIPAVVLCNKLTLYEEPSASSRAVQTLKYQDQPIVVEQKNGWAYCVLGDSEDSPAGWVDSDFIVVDPSWFQADKNVSVYALNKKGAPKVARVKKDTKLPILRQDGSWILVSLHGGAGWIHL